MAQLFSGRTPCWEGGAWRNATELWAGEQAHLPLDCGQSAGSKSDLPPGGAPKPSHGIQCPSPHFLKACGDAGSSDEALGCLCCLLWPHRLSSRSPNPSFACAPPSAGMPASPSAGHLESLTHHALVSRHLKPFSYPPGLGRGTYHAIPRHPGPLSSKSTSPMVCNCSSAYIHRGQPCLSVAGR